MRDSRESSILELFKTSRRGDSVKGVGLLYFHWLVREELKFKTADQTEIYIMPRGSHRSSSTQALI